MSHEANSLKAIFFALGANGAIAAAKLFAAFYTGSSAMLAEAIHSLADCGNQGLLLIGIDRAKKPPTPDHPLGFGKAVYFWSFIVALMLFSLGGMFSIYEGYHKLDSHEGLHMPWLAVGILAFSVAMESVSLWGCMTEINKARGQKNLWRWFRETRQSELIVVLGEDLAALAGLSMALAAVLLTIFTGNPIFDAAGSIAIGLLLVFVAVVVGWEIQSLLIGQSVEPEVRKAICDFLGAREEVVHVFNTLTLQMGEDVMLAVKAEMREASSPAHLIRDINRCEEALRAEFPKLRWIFFEPDNHD
jgi:cation diffusion facilitator family transporter